MAGGFGSRYAGGKTAPAPAGGGGFGKNYQAAPTSTRHAKKAPHGVAGFVHNLGSDVVHSVAGIPEGVVQTVEHPVRTAKATATIYKATYGPLLHGDVSTFLHTLYTHPLGPILDAATVFTGGAALGAKVGILSSDAAALALRSPAAFANPEGHIVERLTSHNPAIRARQRLVHDLLNRLPYDTPHIGEAARYGKMSQRVPRRAAAQLLRTKEARAYDKAVRGLSGEELAAMHLIGRGLHPDEYVSYLRKAQEQGDHVEPAMFKVLENPKVRELVANPDTKISRAVEAGRALSQKDAEVKIAHGLLDPAHAAARPYVAARLISGARFFSKHDAKDVIDNIDQWAAYAQDQLDRKTKLDERLGKKETRLKESKPVLEERANALHNLEAGIGVAQETLQDAYHAWQQGDLSAKDLADLQDEAAAMLRKHERAIEADKSLKARADELARVIADRQRNRNHADYLNVSLDAKAEQRLRVADEAGSFIGGKPLEQIQQELAAAGRPEPFYLPDVAHVRRVSNPEFGKQGLGKGVPKPPKTVMQNTGTRFRTGQIVLNHDVLSREFLSTVKYGLADDLHATLMKGAARISKDEVRRGQVPKGWDFIPKEIISKTGAKRPQQIGEAVRGQRDALAQVEQMFPAEERLANNFKVHDLADAATLHGDYLIAPKSLIDEVAGEFTRSDGVIRQFLDKPFKVWRALVLGFRVGFLTNNLVGNHLLYAIHAAGTDGLRAYLNAVKREHGESMVKSLITMKGIPDPLRRQFMEEFFPEQIEGTFGGTQAVKPRGKTLRKVNRMSTGIAPATQAVAEGTLRRALVETYIRKSPEFKRVYGQLPKQTRDFEHAAAEVMHGEHGDAYQARVSEQVNNALGDYLNMGKVEQQVLRQIFPFYAWYRAILRITAHLALDTPGRADILARIGQIGDVSTKDLLGPLPDYLLGLVPVGHGDHPTVLATKGANPFSTVSDIGSGVKGVLTGNPGETGKAFTQLGPNPFLLAAIQNLSGKNLFTGGDLHGSGGLPGQVTKEIAGQLPQVTLIKALLGDGKESKLYGKQTGTQAVEQFSGVPLKRLDKKRANRSAERDSRR